jgi:hypothetical protein
MLNEELFNALKEIEASSKRGLSVLEPKSEGDEDRNKFDDFVLRVIRLKELGYVEFDENRVKKDKRATAFRYTAMICPAIKYSGMKALARGSFDNYRETETKLEATSVYHFDQSVTFHGDVNHSNIAAHSSHVTQSQKNADLAMLLNEIIKVLKADASISHNDRQEKLDDVESLHKEVMREKPRREIIQTLYNNLANTASIVSLMMQLQPFIQGLLS